MACKQAKTNQLFKEVPIRKQQNDQKNTDTTAPMEKKKQDHNKSVLKVSNTKKTTQIFVFFFCAFFNFLKKGSVTLVFSSFLGHVFR